MWHFGRFNLNSILPKIEHLRPLFIKDTHREKAPSNQSAVLTKTTNMDIRVIGTTNQLFIRGS